MAVRKAVFPAAGLGARFLPATKAQPKEMLPPGSKIILVTGRNKRAIEDHFDAAFELEYYLQDRGKTDELAQIKTISEMPRSPTCANRPGWIYEEKVDGWRVAPPACAW